MSVCVCVKAAATKGGRVTIKSAMDIFSTMFQGVLYRHLCVRLRSAEDTIRLELSERKSDFPDRQKPITFLIKTSINNGYRG